MEVTINLKCDRSGRTIEKTIDSTEITKYEERQARREAVLKQIEEFFKGLPKDDMPDLIAIYRGEMRHFINVEAEYCDKPVSRLMDQLFHVSDPTERANKARASKAANKGNEKKKDKAETGNADKNKKDAKTGKSGVQGSAPTAG